MTLHFTYEGDSAEVGGRVFRFSKLTVKEAVDVK